MPVWGEKLADRLVENVGWMKKISIPLALAGGVIVYFISNKSLTAASVASVGLLLIAANEYWRTVRILNNPERLQALREIEDKRQAHVVAYGGIWRELRILAVIAVGVVCLYFFR